MGADRHGPREMTLAQGVLPKLFQEILVVFQTWLGIAERIFDGGRVFALLLWFVRGLLAPNTNHLPYPLEAPRTVDPLLKPVMPRRNADLVVDEDPPSSPAHPSHHNRVNPYAQASAQVKRNLKRSATTASLPSPPATTSKRRQYTRPVSDTEDDDVEKTPTKATRATRRTATAHESPDNTTPKGKTIVARGRAETNTGTSPALTSLSVRGRSRSPTPVSNDQPLPPPSLLSRLSGAQRALIEEDETESEEESDVAPATPKRDVTPPPTRRTRSTTRNDPIRDSPNNPFLTSGDTPPRRPKVRNDELPLHERDTFTMV